MTDLSVCVCCDRVDGELTSKSAGSEPPPSHVPLRLRPACMADAKPVVEEWDPYRAGDISAHILRDYCMVRNNTPDTRHARGLGVLEH